MLNTFDSFKTYSVRDDESRDETLASNVFEQRKAEISFMLSSHKQLTSRRTYKVYDLVAEVGGILCLTYVVGSFLSYLTNFNSMLYSLTPDLFEIGRKRDDDEKFRPTRSSFKRQASKREEKRLNLKYRGELRLNCLRYMPGCLFACCKKATENSRLLLKGHQKLGKEISVVRLLQ